MTKENFNDYIQDKIKYILCLMGSKGEEYARGDRFSNFRKAANFSNSTDVEMLWNFTIKHLVSVDDFVKDYSKGKVQPIDKWDEKINDIIVYMFLLGGMLRDNSLVD
jgi:hypothetical protein